MFSRVSVFIAAAAAALAVAGPVARTGSPESCNTGPVQCCNSTQQASNPVVATLLGLLGIAGLPITTIVGLTCTSIPVLSAAGNSCTGQTVCCNNNNFNGVVALGCTPINISP